MDTEIKRTTAKSKVGEATRPGARSTGGKSTVRRKNVTLDEATVALVDELLQKDNTLRDLLSQKTGLKLKARLSEAEALRALIALGAQQVKDAELEAGYAALAAARDDEDRAHHEVHRARRAHRDAMEG